MYGWRRKFLFALIMFFAGFSTAVYTLAPGKSGGQDAAYSNVNVSSKSEVFSMKFNVGMRKCLSFAEDKAAELSKVVKAKLAERQIGSKK